MQWILVHTFTLRSPMNWVMPWEWGIPMMDPLNFLVFLMTDMKMAVITTLMPRRGAY